MTDTPDWWEEVFSQKEIDELEATAGNIIDNDDEEYEPDHDGKVSVTVYVPVEKLASTLKGLMETYRQTEGEYKTFIHMLGIGLATEYFTDTEIEYEDTITAYASFFVQFDDIEESDDDEDDETEDEDEDE